MPEPHPACLPPEMLLSECEVRFLRRSGPGGQNRNKVETAAILRHAPTGLSAEANERRSQSENREAALFRLRLLLALEVRRDAPPDQPPSALWAGRCRDGKILVNPRHEDFPSMLAEALDVLHARGEDLRDAAESLGCSPSQLLKLFREEPRALAALNASRKARGLHPWK